MSSQKFIDTDLDVGIKFYDDYVDIGNSDFDYPMSVEEKDLKRVIYFIQDVMAIREERKELEAKRNEPAD